jgi:hypothetical protein
MYLLICVKLFFCRSHEDQIINVKYPFFPLVGVIPLSFWFLSDLLDILMSEQMNMYMDVCIISKLLVRYTVHHINFSTHMYNHFFVGCPKWSHRRMWSDIDEFENKSENCTNFQNCRVQTKCVCAIISDLWYKRC